MRVKTYPITLRGVFPGDEKSKLIDLSNQIRAKRAQYPFMITNNEAEDKPSMHWWSFLDTQEKDKSFLFDSFDAIEQLSFLVKNDKKIFKKVIKGMQPIFKKGNEVTRLKWSFKRCNYQRTTQKEL